MSTRGRYGTRAMLELALNYEQGPILLKDIAKRQEVSFRYLDHLITRLKAAGLVKSIRGRGGGYILGKHPSQIRLIEVIQVLEGSIAPVDCVDDPKLCHRVDFCGTRDIWIQLKEAMANILKSVTLEELAERQKEKVEQLPVAYDI
ncbi:MAG: Rrf2 family transcriptional regulator [Pseudomonadota bacterium]